MVFFGSKSSKLLERQINNVVCTYCNNPTSMTYTLFGEYAHVYWIPMFPLGRKNFVECNSCKRTFKMNELPESTNHKVRKERESAKTPLWYFSGLTIIILGIGYGAWASNKNDENNSEFIKTPKIGDVYSIDGSSNGLFSSMKVTEVTGDSVYVLINDYETDKRSGISSINKNKNYTSATFSFSKEEIINLYDDKTIFDIERD